MNTSKTEKRALEWNPEAYKSFFYARKPDAWGMFCCDCLYYTGNREAGDEHCTGQERCGSCSAFVGESGAPAFQVLWNRHACGMFSPLDAVYCKYEEEC